jgi:hypothetical protein
MGVYVTVGTPASAECAPQNSGQQLNTIGGYDLSKISFPCPSGDGGTCFPVGSSASVFRCNARGERYSSTGEAQTLAVAGVVGDCKIFCDVPLYVPPTLG